MAISRRKTMTTIRAVPPTRHTVALCIAFDGNATTPYYRQIYEGVRAAILEGRLEHGERLPSTRTLARELGVSRLPVLNAYDQLLHEGYLLGRVGAGTYVAARPVTGARPPSSTDRRGQRSVRGEGDLVPPLGA